MIESMSQEKLFQVPGEGESVFSGAITGHDLGRFCLLSSYKSHHRHSMVWHVSLSHLQASMTV